MAPCRVDAITWKERRAYRLSNGVIELTILSGGGHIAELRLCGSDVNALWEAPWPTIEPQDFQETQHPSLYGQPVVGRMLSGYTGHAVALGYFGMPSQEDAERGFPLHGEAVAREWKIAEHSATATSATLTLQTELPISGFHFRRTLALSSNSKVVHVAERLTNRRERSRSLQWVEHAAFGEPLLAAGEATLSLSGDRCVTWPNGYEGHELLPNHREFTWPNVAGYDLSEPFLKEGTGFVAAVRVRPHANAFAVVHNRKLSLAAGYVFSAEQFPWIALWEEYRARDYAPWNGTTKVRGVEFGSSPMPLGLEQAVETQSLFDTPTVFEIAANGVLEKSYAMFVTRVPAAWQRIADAHIVGDRLVLSDEAGDELRLESVRPQECM